MLIQAIIAIAVLAYQTYLCVQISINTDRFKRFIGNTDDYFKVKNNIDNLLYTILFFTVVIASILSYFILKTEKTVTWDIIYLSSFVVTLTCMTYSPLRIINRYIHYYKSIME